MNDSLATVAQDVRTSYARLLVMLADGWEIWTARGLHRSTYLRQPDGKRYAEHLHYRTLLAFENRGWLRRMEPTDAGREWRITPKGRSQAEFEREKPETAIVGRA